MTITIQIDLTYCGYTARTTPNSVWVFDPMGATVGHISPGVPGHADMREQIEAIERGLSMARDMIDGITENDLPSGAHWTDAWTDIAPCMVSDAHDARMEARFEALAHQMGEGLDPAPLADQWRIRGA